MSEFIEIGKLIVRKSEISNIELGFKSFPFSRDFGQGIIYIELMNGKRRAVRTSFECREVVEKYYQSITSQLV